ncbi:MAG: Tfp pilus assembly protein PilF [Cryomorphaceae bacterium]|jgi:Tfp pilus assembly protein PilF
MKLIYFFLLTFASLALAPHSHAQVQNTAGQKVRPGSIFLSGYSAINEAEKLEAAEKYKDAWNKYHQAMRYYKTLDNNYPEWKKTLVNIRIESTNKCIARVEPLAQKEQLAKQEKYKKYVESNTSENGIPSPNLPQLTGREQQRVADLSSKEKQYKILLNKTRREHKIQTSKLNQEIENLQASLNKAAQGMGVENSQAKILNDQIRKLQTQLRSSHRQSKSAQKKTIETLDKLTRERAQLATAPLKKDIEKLAQDKQRLEDELGGIVRIHQKLREKHKKLAKERNEILGELKLHEGALKKKTADLEKSKTASHKVVKALRDQIKAQDTQISGLRGQVTALNAENQGLRTQLNSANEINAELTQNLASVTLERDKLSELLDLSDGDRTKKTIKEALRLGEELREAQNSIKELQANQNVAQDRINRAENKLVVAKNKIINLQIQNTSYIRRIGSLEENLRTTKEQLEKRMANGAKNPLQAEEVRTLKTALKRITTQLERRKQAEQILIAEYQKANINNPGLTNAIVNLTKSNVTLTARESQMLKEQADTDKFTIKGSTSPEARQAAKVRSQNQIESLESLARRCVEKGSLQTAKDIFDEAYDAHGHHYPFFINRGVVRVQMGEFMEAEEIFESGSQLKENNAYTHFMLGYCRFKSSDDVMAKKSLEAAVHIRPDYTDAYIYLGLIAHADGNNSKAKDYLTKAVRIDPEHKEAQFNLSQILHLLGEETKAREAYNNALRAGLPPNFEFEKKIGIKKSSLVD